MNRNITLSEAYVRVRGGERGVKNDSAFVPMQIWGGNGTGCERVGKSSHYVSRSSSWNLNGWML